MNIRNIFKLFIFPKGLFVSVRDGGREMLRHTENDGWYKEAGYVYLNFKLFSKQDARVLS